MSLKKLFNNLQFKVLLLFLFLAIVPLFIVTTFSIRTAEELIINLASNQLVNVANDKVSLLERWILERKADLNVIAKSSILKSMDTDQIAPYLRIVGEYYKVYIGFAVISSDKRVVYDSSFIKDKNFLNGCYKCLLLDRLYISDISLIPVQKKSYFCVSAPILNNNDNMQGTICAAVDTDTIQSIILRVSLGETGECYLVDKNGTFLAHKEPKRILTENIAQSDSFKNIFGDGNYKKIYIDYRGIEVLGTSRRISNTDWYLVVEQDRDEAFRSADRLKRHSTLLIIFFMILAVSLAWLFSHYLAYPIKILSENTKKVARGEFENIHLKTDRRDEIGVLYHAFEYMKEQLKERQQILKEKVTITEAELIDRDMRLKETQLAAERSHHLAALGRLAAGVTHEIRTPLTSIKLFLQSVKGEITISPDFEEDFDIAMKQIKRMEATINRFLDFAKPQEPIFSQIDIQKLIEECLIIIKPRANQQEIIIEIEIEQNLPLIEGDKKQLSEAFLNILVNAIEVMTNKGILTIRGTMDKCVVDGKESEYLRTDISDTGSGISKKDIPRLFDPFFTTKASGSGLGLSIAYNTVKSHGGVIRVSKGIRGTGGISRGTTFSIFLPRLADSI